ncbi:MAG: hypothetical protein JKP90_11510 [Desulfofustis sp. PB-SRB1]|nr:hypothetical protein [Desulfofustis sp. PB-SRB1]
MERAIIHINVADFAVAVERATDATLRRGPLIVAPLAAARPLVFDMSEEAYGDGVRKGMALSRATRMCRAARVVAPRFAQYQRAMAALVNESRHFTPTLEAGMADGHLFLDVTGTHRLFGAAPEVSWRLAKEVRNTLNIRPIWTLASNKLVAKVASRLVKPVGEYIVAEGEEEHFLAPLSPLLLPGLRADERRCLIDLHIDTIGALALFSPAQLGAVFGSRASRLHDLSRGIDQQPLSTGDKRAPAMSREHEFADDTDDYRQVAGVITTLAAAIGNRLRADRLAGRRLTLTLRFTDGTAVTRQLSRKRGSAVDHELRDMAQTLLKRCWQRRIRVRGCRLRCDRLHRHVVQLSLFTEPARAAGKTSRLLAALDAVHAAHGADAIRYGGQHTA